MLLSVTAAASYMAVKDYLQYEAAAELYEKLQDEFLGNAKEKSTFKSMVEITENDTLITLSTCSYEYNHARYIVIGKLNRVYAASKAPPKAAIQIRNREMVDRADLVLCAIERQSGGAWQTVQYAMKQEKPVINLFDEPDE